MAGRASSAESSTAGASRRSSPGASLGASSKLNVQRNPFECARCKRAFPTTYALGGHQNAHRKERNEERMEERRKKPKETPILCPTPLKAVLPTDRQIVEYLAIPVGRPESSHGPMPWFEPRINYESQNAQGFIPGMGKDFVALASNQEFVGDNGHVWGIPYGVSFEHQNYYDRYVKYLSKQSMPVQEMQVCEERDFLGLAGRGGARLEEFPHATEKDETSRAHGDVHESVVPSKTGLDLTLRL